MVFRWSFLTHWLTVCLSRCLAVCIIAFCLSQCLSRCLIVVSLSVSFSLAVSLLSQCCAGGGVVGFPVAVLVLGFDSPQGRDFAVLIQAVGMNSAAFLILYTKPHMVHPHHTECAERVCSCTLSIFTLHSMPHGAYPVAVYSVGRVCH